MASETNRTDSSAIAQARAQSLSTMLRRAAERHGDKTAIICGDVTWSYAEFHEEMERLAAGLRALGVMPGDRVAILARNSHAFMALRFAIARADAVLVPINFMLTVDDVRYILEHSGARVLFADMHTIETARGGGAGLVSHLLGMDGEGLSPPADVPSWVSLRSDAGLAPEARGGEDLLQIVYTSGTESRPKGAMLSHNSVLWQYQSCIIDCEWTPDTVALHAMPLFHCAQLDAMIGPALHVGARNIITSSPAADNVLKLLSEHRITSFFAPPTVWISLLRSPDIGGCDLSRLVKGYYGASIMPVEVLRELRELLPQLRLWNLYGQTEIAPVATILFPEEHAQRLGSAGRPTLHVETCIVDDAMNPVAVGEIGEIVHRSPQLLSGYWQDPERTAEAFAGGWFHSGDLGTHDAEGYITVVDRKKDMIKTGGENVASREVEEALYRHAAISEVAVIGLPDPKWIEAVTAVIVLRDGHRPSEAEVMAHCAQHLAGFKAPKRVIFAENLPRNASGKILKRDLRLSLVGG
ncbi:fatty acyl-CoA synthetase [Polymorphobacter multimanifer]|uniref:3-methylmercaptopropionyl-CoA ligase n=1 Tax=Polymorphobacter multimanifer TaxID=1070431 RepID=A0A841L9Z7_9SPHN|nr:fatty acyl-CoA synthetase [Polymorphobacter multimanifer]MBB6228966.1 fatty-acyl-CoA synthase [Polymorphobacter multimanifer]